MTMYIRYLLKGMWENHASKRANVLLSEEFKQFVEYFSHCPVCHRKNEVSHLSALYISGDSVKRKIREDLLKVIVSSKMDGKKVIVGIPCCTCFDRFFNNKPSERYLFPSSSDNPFYERTYHVNDLTEAEFERLYYKFRPFLEKNLSIDISLLEQNYDLRTVINRILSQITLFQINLITLDIFEDIELMDFLHYLIGTYPRR